MLEIQHDNSGISAAGNYSI